jgi:nitroimidazol reductase NimA-like FMN-containing flavoprotein (pyridoxamine 5'-phosphate oxidase superfamily)
MVEGEELGAIARRVIDSNQFITIGTADEESVPWVSPAWYAPAEYREFFWVSDPEARHSRNIAARPQVAIVIFDSHEAGGWKAVYVSATAGEVTGADVERGIELFNRKSVDRGLREWTAEDVRAPAKHRLSRGDGAAAVEELKRLSGRALVVFSGAKVAFLATERDLGVILEVFSFSGTPDEEAP